MAHEKAPHRDHFHAIAERAQLRAISRQQERPLIEQARSISSRLLAVCVVDQPRLRLGPYTTSRTSQPSTWCLVKAAD